MTTWAIGDIQGCCTEFERLLEEIRFTPECDTLWLVGDLVNRGPRSLDTLRAVRRLGERAVTVLGNHDLHLLAVAAGAQILRPQDTLQAILDAPDAGELLEWLRHRPLFHHDARLGFSLVHAGLPPEWNSATAADRAREVEAVLRGPDWRDFLQCMYGNEPDRWSPALQGADRLRYIVNACTRLRYCSPDGRLDFHNKLSPDSASETLQPWFAIPGRRSAGERIVFGHWSTLGTVDPAHRVFPLDTGCVWGGKLTALKIDDEPEYAQVNCPGAVQPG